MVLELGPYGACYPLSQLIYLAMVTTNDNMGSIKSILLVSRFKVNEVVFEKVLTGSLRMWLSNKRCHVSKEIWNIKS